MRCRSHRLANLLLRELGERTAAYMNMIAATGLSSVRQRVVRHLLDLAAEGDGGALVAHLTQQELADHVGTVREVVARILRELREEDLISTSRDKITLLDPTRLHEHRLVELKRQWDPGNRFRLNQNIPPV